MSSNDPQDTAQLSQGQRKFNRRKSARVDIYAVTRYFDFDRNDDVGIQTRIADLSVGGAMLLTFEEGIPLGANITLGFVVPLSKPVSVLVHAKVRHTAFLEKDLYRSGVEFTKIKKKDLDAINVYVSLRKK